MKTDLINLKIFLNKDKNGIRQPNGTFSGQNASDFFLNVPLYINFNKYDEYINIDRDKSTTDIKRNNFNPFYIELGFFSSIKATSSTGQTNSNEYTPTETIIDKSKFYKININK